MPILYSPENQVFHLQNDRISYIIRLVAGKYPIHQYWGKKVRAIHADVMERCCNQREEGFTLHELPLDTLPQECPVFGCGDMRQGMLEVRQADGSSALDLCYDSHEILKGKPALKGLPSARGEEAETLVLRLRDEHSGVAVELSYSVYPDIDVIARNMRVVNDGEQPVVLERALSACVDLENTHAQLTTLSGAWARERQMVTRPLVPGHQGVESVRGASSHQACPFMALGKSTVTEDEGEVYALSLCYSGSFWADVFVDCNDMARAQIGIQPFQFSWELKPGDSFQTPEAYLCYSANGLNGMSREFHHLCGRYITRGKYAHASRPLLVNNWEATYFDFNEDKLLELAACAKDVGIDLFVLDDGWFGHRDVDNSSLGDWVDDRRKLPNGLRGLSDKIHGLGLKFGLWFEPEMVNPDSDVARNHPDWILSPTAGRLPLQGRTQQVLDLTNPDAFDYIYGCMDQLVGELGIDYIKWDHNKLVTEEVSPLTGRPAAHAQTLAVYRIFTDLKAAHPGLEIESCSSGGGRIDLGILEVADRVWASDCVDPVERADIQRYTSLLVPPEMIGEHVGASPAHSTHRATSQEMRMATAFFGHMGIEWNLLKEPQEDIDKLSEWTAEFKKHREWFAVDTVVHSDAADPAVRVDGCVMPNKAAAIYRFTQLTTSQTYPSAPVYVVSPLDVSLDLVKQDIGNGQSPLGWWTADGVKMTGRALAAYGIRPPALHPAQAVLFKVVRI